MLMKHEYGPITNQAGETESITVENKLCPMKDLIIGFGFIVIGTGYMLMKSFKAGADAYEQAEIKTMTNLHIIK
jgi:hypothetical protein